jgi:HD-like signal output (HDOD) protein
VVKFLGGRPISLLVDHRTGTCARTRAIRGIMASASAPTDRQDGRSSVADPALDAVLALVKRDEVKVPPIPAVVGKLSEQLKNSEIDLRAVTSMVGTDQALSAHILRCSSQTLLASRGQVTSLSEAVMRVGTNGLFSLVVSFCLGRDVSRVTPLQSLRRDVFRRAAARAEFCRRMAPSHGADPDGAFLCGLLSSFGVTVALGAVEQVLSASPRLQQSRSARSWMDIARRCDEESAASVASRWGMPKLVTDVITMSRSGEGDPSLAAYVKLLERADQLTELFYREAAPSEEDIVRAIGCSASAAAEIAAFLPQLAATVHALNSDADDLRPQSVPILIEAPSTALRGEVVPASIPVTVERKGGDQQIVCVGLAADGFVAHGTQPLPLNQVVKCVLLGVEEDLELVAFVAGVSKKDAEFRFEMKPMGLFGGHATRWQKLRLESAKEFSDNEALDADTIAERDALAEGAHAAPGPEPRRERRESPRPGREPDRSERAAGANHASVASEAPVDAGSPDAIEFGPIQEAAPPASGSAPRENPERGSSSGPPREGRYVSLKSRPSVFRRFADWINGRDIE